MPKNTQWKPKEYGRYFYFNISIQESDFYAGSDEDKQNVKTGNCFSTKSAAQSALKKIKEILKSE